MSKFKEQFKKEITKKLTERLNVKNPMVLPRVRDFSGIAPNAFDGRGNLSIGFTENTVFPEIDSGKVDRVRSLQVTIITNAGDNERARVLLEEMGMRFKK